MNTISRLANQRLIRLQLIATFCQYRELLWKLSEREVAARYRGSALGMLWSLITPLLMLAVYTFVFTTVFNARWGAPQEANSVDFALNLFAGLIVFNVFAECATRAPTLILSNANLVKKVVFPLEVLSASTVASALFHAVTSTGILITFEIIAKHTLPISIAFLPFVWLPLALGCLALSWLLSALGVFLRDLTQVMNVLVSMLMFLSAIFYPISALPASWQPVLQLNPLVIVIEQSRKVMIDGVSPDTSYLLIGSISMIYAAELSLRLFMKAKRGFSDVL